MRKTILILAASISVTSMLAQGTPEQRFTNTMDKGVNILPQKGDFAIGIDASPAFTFIGNIFNGNTNNNGSNLFGENHAIRGKYFLTDNTAVRATFELNTNTTNHRIGFDDPTSTATKKPIIYNTHSNRLSGFRLNVGYEMRRGYGKLQGFFGPEVGLGSHSTSISNSYALEMNKKNVTEHGQPSSRVLKEKLGGAFTFNIGAFAGVEYFVLPKLSIGGEVSFGLNHLMESKVKKTTESWTEEDGTKTKEIKVRRGSDFNLNTTTKGALFINFHF